MKVEQIGFAKRLAVGNESGILPGQLEEWNGGIVDNEACFRGWGRFHELIFRLMFNLKCLLNIQVEMSSRKLTM